MAAPVLVLVPVSPQLRLAQQGLRQLARRRPALQQQQLLLELP